MLRADYTDEARKSFHQLRYRCPAPRIMRRFEILCLHSCGKFAPEIAEIVKQTPSTVRKVIKMFQTGGIELVSAIDSNHPKSDLEEHRVSLIEGFKKRPPATAKEAAYRIEQLTGVKRNGCTEEVAKGAFPLPAYTVNGHKLLFYFF